MGKHIMLNLWFTLVSTRMCCKALKLTVHFWASQIRIHTVSFLHLKPIHMPENTFSGVYMDTCSHWHAHVKSRWRTVSATEWKMNFHRLTDSFVQLFLEGLKWMFNNMEPFILFHVSYIHHVMLILSLFFKKVKPQFFNVRINFE